MQSVACTGFKIFYQNTVLMMTTHQMHTIIFDGCTPSLFPFATRNILLAMNSSLQSEN